MPSLLAAMLTLALVAAATLLLRQAAQRTESATRVASTIDTTAWGRRAADLEQASHGLRDAVDRRLPR